MSPIRRWLVKAARTVHLYVTLFGFALLVFFAITGFMLNHESWFVDQEKEPRRVAGRVGADMLEPLNKLAIENMLRRDYDAAGALDPVTEDELPIRMTFRRPGRRVEAEIRTPDEEQPDNLEVSYFHDGAAGVMLDLHRGKSSGRAWSLIIDGLCILVLIVATTGLFLWTSLRGRGRYTFIIFLTGIGVGLGAYLFFVP